MPAAVAVGEAADATVPAAVVDGEAADAWCRHSDLDSHLAHYTRPPHMYPTLNVAPAAPTLSASTTAGAAAGASSSSSSTSKRKRKTRRAVAAAAAARKKRAARGGGSSAADVRETLRAANACAYGAAVQRPLMAHGLAAWREHGLVDALRARMTAGAPHDAALIACCFTPAFADTLAAMARAHALPVIVSYWNPLFGVGGTCAPTDTTTVSAPQRARTAARMRGLKYTHAVYLALVFRLNYACEALDRVQAFDGETHYLLHLFIDAHLPLACDVEARIAAATPADYSDTDSSGSGDTDSSGIGDTDVVAAAAVGAATHRRRLAAVCDTAMRTPYAVGGDDDGGATHEPWYYAALAPPDGDVSGRAATAAHRHHFDGGNHARWRAAGTHGGQTPLERHLPDYQPLACEETLPDVAPLVAHLNQWSGPDRTLGGTTCATVAHLLQLLNKQRPRKCVVRSLYITALKLMDGDPVLYRVLRQLVLATVLGNYRWALFRPTLYNRMRIVHAFTYAHTRDALRDIVFAGAREKVLFFALRECVNFVVTRLPHVYTVLRYTHQWLRYTTASINHLNKARRRADDCMRAWWLANRRSRLARRASGSVAHACTALLAHTFGDVHTFLRTFMKNVTAYLYRRKKEPFCEDFPVALDHHYRQTVEWRELHALFRAIERGALPTPPTRAALERLIGARLARAAATLASPARTGLLPERVRAAVWRYVHTPAAAGGAPPHVFYDAHSRETLRALHWLHTRCALALLDIDRVCAMVDAYYRNEVQLCAAIMVDLSEYARQLLGFVCVVLAERAAVRIFDVPHDVYLAQAEALRWRMRMRADTHAALPVQCAVVPYCPGCQTLKVAAVDDARVAALDGGSIRAYGFVNLAASTSGAMAHVCEPLRARRQSARRHVYANLPRWLALDVCGRTPCVWLCWLGRAVEIHRALYTLCVWCANVVRVSRDSYAGGGIFCRACARAVPVQRYAESLRARQAHRTQRRLTLRGGGGASGACNYCNATPCTRWMRVWHANAVAYISLCDVHCVASLVRMAVHDGQLFTVAEVHAIIGKGISHHITRLNHHT